MPYLNNIEELVNASCLNYGASRWQNYARRGLKIDAIKEVRSTMGYGLKEAKDVVEYWLSIQNNTFRVDVNASHGKYALVTAQEDGAYTIEFVQSDKSNYRNLQEAMQAIAAFSVGTGQPYPAQG